MRRKLVVGLVLVSVTSVVIVALMAALGTVTPNTLWFEVAKIVLQVGLVSAFGAALSLLTYEYQQEAQRTEKAREDDILRRESQQELLRSVLARAATTYIDVKRARRFLRGSAMTADPSGGTVVIAVPYDQQIAAINDAQLEFEVLADDMRGAQSAFPSVAMTLAERFDDIENSLNRLISEYEEARPRFSGEPLALKLEKLPVLDVFLSSTKRQDPSMFARGFGPVHDNFAQVQRLIWKELLATAGTADAASPNHQPPTGRSHRPRRGRPGRPGA